MINRLSKQLLIAILLTLHCNIYAQYQVVVLDRTNNQPIAYAGVYFPDLKTSTSTNHDGLFTISSKGKPLLVQITSIGYTTLLETLTITDDTTFLYMESSHYDLQEIVVSGTSSRLQGENVLNVEKANISGNQEMQGLSLAQKLSSVAGVSNISTGTGIGKPVIRGLSGNRIAVFAQGIRVENQQWGDEHGLGLDENGYEHVEIIKGTASLLYGSDAIGGVLYFADEKYAEDNSIEASVTSEYRTNTNGYTGNGTLKLSKNHFHWNAFGGHTANNDYYDGYSNKVDNSRFKTGNFKTAMGYTGANFNTSIKYSFLNEKYGLLQTAEEEQPADGFPYQFLTTHLLSSENTFFLGNTSKLKLDLGYIFNSRQEFEEENTDGSPNLDMHLSTFSYNVKWYQTLLDSRWSLIAGSQGMHQSNINKGNELLIPDGSTSDIGLFVTSDFYYSGKSYLQAGVRIDNRHISSNTHGEATDDRYFPKFSNSYTAFVFSTGLYQQLGKQMQLRLNLASGYRSPNMFELLSNGVHEGVNRYETGNSSLRTENSYQADLSIKYGSRHLTVYINPFINHILHYIHIQPTGYKIDNMPVYVYAQSDATLYGGESGFHFHPHPWDWLHIEATYSSVFGRDTERRNLPLIPSQKINIHLRTSFSAGKNIPRISLYLHAQHSLAQNNVTPYETATPAYSTINTGLAFDIKAGTQKISLSLSANNIFNEKYYDHLSRYKTEQIYDVGRSFNFKISLPLQFRLR